MPLKTIYVLNEQEVEPENLVKFANLNGYKSPRDYIIVTDVVSWLISQGANIKFLTRMEDK